MYIFVSSKWQYYTIAQVICTMAQCKWYACSHGTITWFGIRQKYTIYTFNILNTEKTVSCTISLYCCIQYICYPSQPWNINSWQLLPGIQDNTTVTEMTSVWCGGCEMQGHMFLHYRTLQDTSLQPLMAQNLTELYLLKYSSWGRN